MSDENNGYNADSIQVLHGLEAVRKRPGMYIGSTDQKGLHHLVYEVVDNSIDEAMAGHCDKVVVVLEKDDICRVEDNGRGIPVAMNTKEKVSALELALTSLHAGGKFDKNTYKVSGGLHGVGVSCVNALSIWLTADVKRDGYHYRQKYEIGVPKSGVEQLEPTEEHGTTIRWKADASIFKETTTYNFDILSSRLRELAFLNPGVIIVFRDERLETPKEVVYKFDGGINQYIEYLNVGKQIIPAEPVYLKGDANDGQGNEVLMEVSMQWNDGYSESIHSYVNDINTRDGGTHLEGFKSGLGFVMKKEFEKREKLVKKLGENEKLAIEDVASGLTAVLSVKVPDPQFVSQTKDKLGNSEVRSYVDQLIKEKFTLWCEQNPNIIDEILSKAVNEASARIAARKARENTRKKTGTGFSKPEKLADCSIKNDPARCEVYIVEGDSAGGSAKKGRDSKTQAILPLWGKMLNVEKVRPEKVFENDKLKPVIQTLGAGFGKDFNIEKLRYHKVIIMADADVDGSHIRTLLLTFFFRYMPKLIEDGYVYLAMPPLYGVSVGKKTTYVYTDEERRAELDKLGEKAASAKVQRYKGLGEMDGDELWSTTMDPTRRKMKRVTIPDAIAADRIFSVCMGEEVEPRRKFIEENAASANLDF